MPATKVPALARGKREERASIWSEMQAIVEGVETRGDGFTADESTKFDRMDADLNRLGEEIRQAERFEKLSAEFDAIDERTVPVAAGETALAVDSPYPKAFRGFLRGGLDSLDLEQRRLVHANFVTPENRAQGVGTGAAGGYTVPEGFRAKITETLKWWGGMITTSEIISTDTGNDLPWPTNDDTGNVGVLLNENAVIADATDLAFGAKMLKAFVFSSTVLRASNVFLQDSATDPEGYIAKKGGQRVGRVLNTYFTTGSGANQPQGLITGLTVGVTTASATAITYGELVDTQHSVDVAYRLGGTCRWMMHDLALAYIRKLVDGQSRPLWVPGGLLGSIEGGDPDRLLGYPVTLNNDMDSTIAATKKTAVFGDISSAYAIRQINDIQLVRLTERYADYGQVGFIVFARYDGLVQDPSAAKVLQQHA